MANAKVTEHEPEPEDSQVEGGAEGVGDDDPVEKLRQELNKAKQDLTKRINAINTALSNTETELTKKVDGAQAEVKKLKTSVDNNKASIDSFQGSIDTLNRELPKLATALDRETKRLDNVENWQSAFNTSFVKGIQQAKDFALEQGNDAKAHADQVGERVENDLSAAKSELDQRIHAVENAPVKPHTHSVSLSGQTGAVQQVSGGGK